ncbi:thioesterase II family protein [Streptomyces sp. URMC 124]|uniref:thioesterase II family protein n=1 Tax=Streptomyces sp. URMC 124 TaxID=3423405 RepID=UPI003F1CF65C
MRALGDGLLWDLSPEGTGAGADLAALLLPGAGGGARDFALWPRHLVPRFRVLAAQYSGRDRAATATDASTEGSTHASADASTDGSPSSDLLGAALAERVAHHVQEPLVLFGHSMGAAVGYETAWQLTLRRRPALALHASAALAPPEYAGIDLGIRAMDDTALAGLARALAIPFPRDDRPRERQAALRALRHDLALVDAYDYGPSPRPLDYPITVWSARDDAIIPAAAAGRWQAMTRHPLAHRTLPVSHHHLSIPAAVTAITRSLHSLLA